MRFFFSPAGAAVFLPASFFSAGALPAGALPPVVGVFCAFGGMFSLVKRKDLETGVKVELIETTKSDLTCKCCCCGSVEEVGKRKKDSLSRWGGQEFIWRARYVS